MSITRIRRLCAQQAHCDAVVDCLKSSPSGKITESQQELLCKALGLVDPSSASFWPSLPLAYRLRLLKRVLDNISREDEAHEALLHAYCNPVADGEPGWSVQTFFPEEEEDKALQLRVSAGIGGGTETGGRVWPAALGLSAYILAEPLSLADLAASTPLQQGVVIELGAGPGLPGLLLAQQGAAERIILTDVVPQILENLEYNVRQLHQSPPSAIQVEAYDWCADAEASAARYNGVRLILAADVVYEPELAEPLLRTLDALLRRHTDAVALLAAERRGDAWRNFESLLGARVRRGELRCTDRSERVRAALRAEGCPFWCPPDAIERLVLLEIAAATGLRQSEEAWQGSPRNPSERASRHGDSLPHAHRHRQGTGAAPADEASRDAFPSTAWQAHVSIAARCGGHVNFRVGYKRSEPR
jgi:predicted nicotinamide N-methyase